MPGEYKSNKGSPKAPKMGGGNFGQAGKVSHMNPMPRYDQNRLDFLPYDYRNTPREAFNYKY